jgi:hypothetical protein
MEKLENLTENTKDKVTERCKNCGSKVNIPKALKYWLDDVNSVDLPERSELIAKTIDKAREHYHPDFYLRETTGELFCHEHCYQTYYKIHLFSPL